MENVTVPATLSARLSVHVTVTCCNELNVLDIVKTSDPPSTIERETVFDETKVPTIASTEQEIGPFEVKIGEEGIMVTFGLEGLVSVLGTNKMTRFPPGSPSAYVLDLEADTQDT